MSLNFKKCFVRYKFLKINYKKAKVYDGHFLISATTTILSVEAAFSSFLAACIFFASVVI